MKAISLWPPWGSFIVEDLKGIETRSWPTKYRGPLAIHQTQVFPYLVVERMLKSSDWFADAYRQFAGSEDFPLGVVLGTARLTDCIEMTPHNIATVGHMEKALGEYSPGRFMWMLEEVVKFETPVPAKGKQGIWEWEPTCV